MPLAHGELAAAIHAAASQLELDGAGNMKLDEARMRDRIAEALAQTSSAWIGTERKVTIPEFRGVGAVDIVAGTGPGGRFIGLIECKWSLDLKRDKIYECAWDAVKLALATRVHPGAAAFLVTGAPKESWAVTESADLFENGTLETRALWDRPLLPKGPNGGMTIGADCEAGGRGNMFTHAPAHLTVVQVAEANVGTTMVIRASAISAPADGVMLPYTPPPEFPQLMSQSWLDQNVASMSDETFSRLLAWLREKRWTQAELNERVYTLRR